VTIVNQVRTEIYKAGRLRIPPGNTHKFQAGLSDIINNKIHNNNNKLIGKPIHRNLKACVTQHLGLHFA